MNKLIITIIAVLLLIAGVLVSLNIGAPKIKINPNKQLIIAQSPTPTPKITPHPIVLPTVLATKIPTPTDSVTPTITPTVSPEITPTSNCNPDGFGSDLDAADKCR